MKNFTREVIYQKKKSNENSNSEKYCTKPVLTRYKNQITLKVNYRTIYLMNKDAKFLNKIFSKSNSTIR